MKEKDYKSKALEKQADKLLKQDEQAQKLKEKGKSVDVNKFRKLL
jgi:hypothetical protein